MTAAKPRRGRLFAVLGGLCALAAVAAGCSALPSRQERQRHADRLAAAKGWQATVIATHWFDLRSYGPGASTVGPAGILTVYIEGDGFAWVTGTQPSDDPTPREPVALQMALAQPGGVAAYLARPCQYTMDESGSGRSCAQRYWTDSRFDEPVVQAASQALDELKQRYRAGRLVLVGYSGGGAVAALLAARRDDVAALVTVAGNVDHHAWTRMHGVLPLAGSLNSADDNERLSAMPQWHLAGGRDRVVPPSLAQDYVRGLGSPPMARVMVEPGFDHTCCWAQEWPRLWNSLGIR